MAGRRPSGEGSIYRRGDGRWAGAAFVETISGQRKRIHVYAATRQEVHDRLGDKLAEARKGIRAPDKEWTVGAYLDYWLDTVVAIKNRPRTQELYESTVRLHLAPGLGSIRLTKLTVGDVQTLLNHYLAEGRSLRTVHKARSVLRAALSRAQREELVVRNVAKLVELKPWRRKPIRPWSVEEAFRFLDAAKSHRWYSAYVMLLAYGMRRGEVLGLRWCDVDLTGSRLHIEQQLQRIGKVLEQGPVKTETGRRELPLIPQLREVLADECIQRFGIQVGDANVLHGASHELVFLSSTGTPIDPKNFVRSFHEIRERAGLRRITVHHTRHTVATLLKNLGVPDRDIQLILGHAHVTTTQQLYQHADIDGQQKALTRAEQQLLTGGVAVNNAVNNGFSTGESTIFRALTSGGATGARTQDTLLKSAILLSDTTSPTSVIRHLRTRAYAQILGHVAVKYCCQPTIYATDHTPDLADWVLLLHALRQTELAVIRERSFPLNLLPRASSVSDPVIQEERRVS